MTTQAPAGRMNQKQRTRTAIIDAARELIKGGAEVSMPAIASAALVSEATAYRYFPDLVSLLREALAGVWPSPAQALEPVAHTDDAVDRIAFATEFLLRGVHTCRSAVRAVISASIIRPESAAMRPIQRFGLIDVALSPLESTLASTNPEAFEQLKRDLAIVMSAEAFFTLTDLCGLSTDAAIRSAVHAARTVTAAAIASS